MIVYTYFVCLKQPQAHERHHANSIFKGIWPCHYEATERLTIFHQNLNVAK